MPTEEEIHDCLADMWDALYGGDLDESERAKCVYECHLGICEELYLAVWERLDAPFRSAWKAYVAQRLVVLRACERDTDRQGTRLPFEH